ALADGREKAHGALGGRALMDLEDIPARDHIAGGEVFEDDAGERPDVERIDLNEIARRGGLVPAGLADGVGAGRTAAGGGGRPAAAPAAVGAAVVRGAQTP